MTKTKVIEPHSEDLNEVGPETKEPIQLIGYETKFLESLLQYLSSKPYGEVRGFIDGIQQGQPVQV